MLLILIQTIVVTVLMMITLTVIKELMVPPDYKAAQGGQETRACRGSSSIVLEAPIPKRSFGQGPKPGP